MNRHDDLEQVYEALTVLARRSRELSADLHPGLSLVAYSLLIYIQTEPGTRAADVAAAYGLDKSTVSRQVDQLVASDLLLRRGERTGRRGQILELTAAGQQALAMASESVRDALVARLADWDDGDIAVFADLLARFNRSNSGGW